MFAFYINKTVDAVQTAKKNWVNNTVFDADLAGHMHKFVDTQTEYTKAAVNNFQTWGMGFAGYATGKTQSALKTGAEWIEKFNTKA